MGWEPDAARWASGTREGHPKWEPILPSAFRVHLNVLLSRSRHQGPPAPWPLGWHHLPQHHGVRTTSPGAHSARSPWSLESRGGVAAGLGAPGRAEEPAWCRHPANSRKHTPKASAWYPAGTQEMLSHKGKLQPACLGSATPAVTRAAAHLSLL